LETIHNRLYWSQCGHRRRKELGESRQLYALDQTNLKADRVCEGIPLVPPTEIATVTIASLTWRYLSNITGVKVQRAV
jgi:hypothetical protein